MIRKQFIIHGRVQHVGFRYFVLNSAVSIGINGVVANRYDGSVWVDAEADPERMELFLAECKKGPSMSRVDEIIITDWPLAGYTSFTIR
jgi:acylphosphatase